jgi:hypothetical protein
MLAGERLALPYLQRGFERPERALAAQYSRSGDGP